MRILFIIQKMYNGGAERVVARLSSELCKRHDVYLAFTDPDPFKKGGYDIDSRVHIVLVNKRIAEKPLRGPLKFCKELITVKNLRTLKLKLQPDVSISFLSCPNYYNVRSSAGEPVIISIRNMMSQVVYQNIKSAVLHRFYDRYSAMYSDYMTVVSHNVGEDQRRLYHIPESKIRCIYNPIDPEKVKDRAKLPLEDEGFHRFRKGHDRLLITIGRLTEQKAQWQMIRAMREIVKRHPNTGLVILGMGNLEKKLKDTIAANRLEQHVYLAGYHLMPFNYLKEADIFVMTSLYEGFSNAMLEAMATGLPIISADSLSGPRELLAPATDPSAKSKSIEYATYGVLTPPFSGNKDLLSEPCDRSEQLFAQAVSEMLSDATMAEHYRAQSALRVQDFCIDRIAAQWEELCSELIQK